MNLKDMTRQGFIDEIEGELWELQKKHPDEWIGLINTYLEAKGIDKEIHYCNRVEICNVFNDSLTELFDNEDITEKNINLNEKYLYKKDNHWYSTDFESDIYDEKDLYNFMFDNQEIFEDYIDFDDMYDDEKAEREDIIIEGYDEFVETEEDEEEWNKLSEDEKYLLSMSTDMGFNFDELNENPEAKAKVEELQSRFSKFKK